MTIDKKLLLVHQHLHQHTPEGIGTYQYAAGMIRMIADSFSHVVNLAPVLRALPADRGAERVRDLVTYPDNVECHILYERDARESKVRVALRHLMATPTLVREVLAADIVQPRLPSYPAVLASFIALAAGKPMLVSIHGNWAEVLAAARGTDKVHWRWLGRLSNTYHRTISRRSAMTLIVGEHVRHLARPDALVIANHQFEAADIARRPDTCLAPPYRLLYVGNLSRGKGTLDLLDSLVMLRAQGVDCTVRLVGKPVGIDVAAEVAARGLGDHVDLLGFVEWGPQLFEVYRTSDILVFPSHSEGIPKVPMEALSQSLPVVATPPGTSTYIKHEINGLLTPMRDPSALAATIRRMIEDGELRRRCIAGGIRTATANTREQMRAHIREALERAFGDPAAG